MGASVLPHWLRHDHDEYGSLLPQQLGFTEMFQIYGSVLPRCVFHGVAGALLGGLLKHFEAGIVQYQEDWHHPYVLHVFGMVLGFSLVMRLQIAYGRLWEGATQCHQASSKWADAVMQVVAFDEASKDAFSEAAFEFRMLFIHYASLMQACALIDMRQDDHIDHRMSVNQEDPFLFQPTATAAVVPAGGAGGAGGTDAAEPKISTGAEYGSASARHLSVPMQAMLTTRAQ